MAVYGGLEETMEKHGDFSVSAIQTLTTRVKPCQFSTAIFTSMPFDA